MADRQTKGRKPRLAPRRLGYRVRCLARTRCPKVPGDRRAAIAQSGFESTAREQLPRLASVTDQVRTCLSRQNGSSLSQTRFLEATGAP